MKYLSDFSFFRHIYVLQIYLPKIPMTHLPHRKNRVGEKRTTFLDILQNDFPETWFVRIFRRKYRNDQLHSTFSATNSRGIRGMLRRSALAPQTLRNRKIRYPLSVVEIRDYAMNFLGEMTTHQGNGEKRKREREERRMMYGSLNRIFVRL